MFSDRGWILKAALALGLLTWLCRDARQRISVAHPDPERAALLSGADFSGTIYLWAKKVEAHEPGGFRIDSRVGPLHFESATQPPVGEYVSIVARPLTPRVLKAESLQVNEGFGWKRPLNYAISVLTLAGYLWVIRRRFRWRIHEGVFRSKY